METNLCGNCDYALMTATGARFCVRHNVYVAIDGTACMGYFNRKKNQIYNQIKDALKV